MRFREVLAMAGLGFLAIEGMTPELPLGAIIGAAALCIVLAVSGRAR